MTQIMILKRDAIENGTRTPPSEGGCAGWNVCMEGALWQTIKLTPPPFRQRCPVSPLLISPRCQKFSSKDLSALQIGRIALPR